MSLLSPLLAVFLSLSAGLVFGQRVSPAPVATGSNPPQQASAAAQIPEANLARLPKPQARLLDRIDESELTTLRGSTHPLARHANDCGAAVPSQPMRRMLMLLRRGPEQEAALDELLDAQQDPGSPLFHHWLTPEQFGAFFGPAEADVQAIQAWLESHGFSGIQLSNGRTVVEFTGTATQGEWKSKVMEEAWLQEKSERRNCFILNGSVDSCATACRRRDALLAPMTVASPSEVVRFARGKVGLLSARWQFPALRTRCRTDRPGVA